MADFVKMKGKTTFQNDRIRGVPGGLVNDGDEFETDPTHAKDLARLGHAVPLSGSVDDIPDTVLEPHHSVSEVALRSDRERRAGGNGGAAANVSIGGAAPASDGLDRLSQQQLRKILDEERIDEGAAETKADVIAAIRTARASRAAA